MGGVGRGGAQNLPFPLPLLPDLERVLLGHHSTHSFLGEQFASETLTHSLLKSQLGTRQRHALHTSGQDECLEEQQGMIEERYFFLFVLFFGGRRFQTRPEKTKWSSEP